MTIAQAITGITGPAGSWKGAPPSAVRFVFCNLIVAAQQTRYTINVARVASTIRPAKLPEIANAAHSMA